MAVYKSMAEYEKKLKKWMKELPDDMVVANRQAAEIVRKEVLTKHLNGRKMPKGVGSESNATLGIKSGDLRASISTWAFRTTSGIKAYVGNLTWPLKYAKYHEYGSSIHPKRPFLRPSLKAKKKDIIDHLVKAIKRSYEDA